MNTVEYRIELLKIALAILEYEDAPPVNVETVTKTADQFEAWLLKDVPGSTGQSSSAQASAFLQGGLYRHSKD